MALTFDDVPVTGKPEEQTKPVAPGALTFDDVPFPPPGVADYAKVGLRTLAETVPSTLASAVSAVQGQAGVEAPGQEDIFEKGIRRQSQRLTEFERDVAQQFPESTGIQTLSRGARQLGYSLTSMVPAVAAGVATAPAALAPVPGAQAIPFVTGGAAGGAVAYRTSSADIMRSYIDTLDEEKRQTEGRGLTPEETETAKAGFTQKATEYGLWEALPEAVGGAVAGRLIFGPLRKIVGEPFARTMLGKLGSAVGVVGEELATEAVTEVGQTQVLAGTPVGEAGSAPEFSAESLLEAAKKVAPDVLLLTGLLGGGAAVGSGIYRARKEAQFAKSLGIDRPTLKTRIQILLEEKAANPNFDINSPEVKQFLAGAVVLKDGRFAPKPAPVVPQEEVATDEVPVREAGIEGQAQVPDVRPEPQGDAGQVTSGEASPARLVAEKIASQTPETTFAPEDIQVVANEPQAVEAELQAIQEARDAAQTGEVGQGVQPERLGDVPGAAQEGGAADTGTEAVGRGGVRDTAQGGEEISRIAEQFRAGEVRYIPPAGGAGVVAQELTPEAVEAATSKLTTEAASVKQRKGRTEVTLQDGSVHSFVSTTPQEPSAQAAVPSGEPAPQAEPGLAPMPIDALPGVPPLKRGYKRTTFSLDAPGFRGDVFVEDTSTKGKKTLTIVRRNGQVVPASDTMVEMIERRRKEGLERPVDVRFARGLSAVQTLISAMARYTGKPVPDGAYTLSSPPKGQEQAYAALSEFLGKQIVFVDVAANAPMKFDGVSRIVPGVLFVNAKATSPHLAVTGHEFLHELKATAPELYQEFKDVVLATIPDGKKEAARKFLAEARAAEGQAEYDPEILEEELVADWFGEQFLTKSFWHKVERQNPDGFTRIVEAFLKFLTGVKDYLTGSQKADLEKAQDAAAQALKRYLEKNPESTKDLSPRFAAAWHGSPHSFDKFSTSAIGTGEGAQVYGWGLYFASNKEVAEWYRKRLTDVPRGHTITVDGVLLSDVPKPDGVTTLARAKAVTALFSAAEPTVDAAFAALDTDPTLAGRDDLKAQGRTFLEQLRGKDIQRVLPPAGAIYQVELAPKEDEYLLWDKPLSEQSEKVKAALENSGVLEGLDEYRKVYSSGGAAKGAEIYKYVAERVLSLPFKKKVAAALGDRPVYGKEARASEYLHSLGIRGIKYLEGASRAKGEGNYNYVIFDEEDVSITAKFSRKLYRGEFPYDPADPQSGETGANAADLFTKGVGRGAFWTTDKEMAEYWRAAGGKRSDGYIREAVLKPSAKELTLITEDGEFDEEGIRVYRQLVPEVANASEDYLFTYIMENGLGESAAAFREAGYDVVHSMDLDGPETLVLNPDALEESARFSRPRPEALAEIQKTADQLRFPQQEARRGIDLAQGPDTGVARSPEQDLGAQAEARRRAVSDWHDSAGWYDEALNTGELAHEAVKAIEQGADETQVTRWFLQTLNNDILSDPEARQRFADGLKTWEQNGIPKGSNREFIQNAAAMYREWARDNGIRFSRMAQNILAEAGQTYGGSFEAVTDTAGIADADSIRRVAAGFGKRLVWYRGRGDNLPEAFSSDTAPDHIFLSADAVQPAIMLLGHELTHTLYAENPELYMQLVAGLSRVSSREAVRQYGDYLRQGYAPEEVPLEIVANMVGSQFGREAFWQKLEQENRTLFERMVQVAYRLVRSIVARAQEFALAEQTLTDLEGAQAVIAKVMAKYAVDFDSPMFSRPFFSKVEEMVSQAKQERWGSANELVNFLKGKTSEAEVAMLGLSELEGKPTKGEVLEKIQEAGTVFEDVVLGEPVAEGEVVGWKLRYKDGSGTFQFYRDREEAESDLADIDPTGERIEIVRETSGSGGAPLRAQQETHFSNYTLPGAVEGSYREMFVTAPESFDATEQITKINQRLRALAKSDASPLEYGEEWDALTKQKKALRAREEGWQDGHSQYDQIKNPIVRVRYNERTGPNGERILFVEEIQGPSDANQEKMPEYLRKRIYDIGVKRVLALAKAQGFDGISWTTGEQQADRYDLSKQVESIGYQKRGETYNVTVWDKQGRQVWQNQSASKEDVAETVGKEILAKMEAGAGHQEGGISYLEGLDLKVGGEGLKRLYDQTLPALFKKYGKGQVGTTNLGKPDGYRVSIEEGEFQDAETLEAAQDIAERTGGKITPFGALVQPFLPVTAQTPDQYPMFARSLEALSEQAKGKLGDAVQAARAALKGDNAAIAGADAYLKIMPRTILVETFGKLVPQLKTFDEALSAQTASRNATIDQGYLIGNAARSAAKKGAGLDALNETIGLNSFYKTTPDEDWEQQEWVPLPLRGQRTSAAKKAAQATWVKAGMPEKTGVADWFKAYTLGREAFEKLDTKTQVEYNKLIKFYIDLRNKDYQAARKGIETMAAGNKTLRDSLIAELNDKFMNTITGNYAPLWRSGDYALSWQEPTGERPFMLFTSVFQRDVVKTRLEARGVTGIEVSYKEKLPRSIAGVPSRMHEQLRKTAIANAEQQALKGIDKADTDGIEAAKRRAYAEVESQLRALDEVFIRWLPESSAAKNLLPRKSVKGYSEDHIEALFNYTMAHAGNIAYLEHGRRVENSIMDAWKDLRSRRKTEDVTLAGKVVEDMANRVEGVRTKRTGPVASFISQLTSAWYMSSPSLMFVQLSQLPILTLPNLAAEFGVNKASTALMQGLTRAFSPKYERSAIMETEEVNKVFNAMFEQIKPSDVDTKLPWAEGKQIGDLRRTDAERNALFRGVKDPYLRNLLVLRMATELNLLDISMSYELADEVRGRSPDSPVGMAYKALLLPMSMSERASRKAAIMAAFDLAYEKNGGDATKAMESVQSVVKTTLYDYAKEGKGVALMGGLANTIAKFQHFRIVTAFHLGRLVYKSLKGESQDVRVQARKEFIGVMLMTAALAGAVGTPFAILFKILDLALGDDDEPVDSQLIASNWLKEQFGAQGGALVMRGAPAALGADVSQRIGLNNIYTTSLFDAPVNAEGSDYAAWIATQILGPSFSMMQGWAQGYDDIQKGEVLRGLEGMTPKALRDIIKAGRFATEGVKTRGGLNILDESKIGADELFLLALGFAPDEVAQTQQRARKVYQMSQRVSQRRSELVRNVEQAITAEDPDAIAEAWEEIVKYNTRMPAFAVTGKDVRARLRNRARGEAGVEERREALVREKYGL